ncbi:hypothetical protein DET53_103457 [Vibrio parahaemolyticus]|nr:hypothetical protein DET53_103457 [Vibrio parahaemolyticus]
MYSMEHFVNCLELSMKNHIAFFSIILSVLSHDAIGGLEGQTVTFHRDYAGRNFGQTQTVTVVDGDSDIFNVQHHEKINIDNNKITIRYIDNNQFGDRPKAFNGYILRGYEGEVASITLLRDDAGIYKNSWFDDDGIHMDLGGPFSRGDILEFEVLLVGDNDPSLERCEVEITSQSNEIGKDGGKLYFNTSASSLSLVTTNELYKYLNFPTGEVLTIDTPQEFKLSTTPIRELDWTLTIPEWYPAGTYTVNYAGLDLKNGSICKDAISFTKLQY